MSLSPVPEVIYPEASVSLSSSPRNVWTHTLTIYYNATPRIGGDLHSQSLRVITPFPLSPQTCGPWPCAWAFVIPLVARGARGRLCGSRNPRGHLRPIAKRPGCVVPGIQRDRPSDA